VVAVTALVALLGVGTGAGLALIVAGWRGVDPDRQRPRLRSMDRPTVLRAVAAVAVAGLAGVATGWAAGAILAGLAAWFVPRVFGQDTHEHAKVARIEGIATWTEMLRDTLAAAAGLEQAITATAPLVPDPISKEIGALAARLEDGQPLAPALRALGDELDDPTADLVVSALVSAAEHRAGRLAALLGSLAAAAREHVALRRRIAASQAQARTTVRITVAVTLLYAVGLTVLDRRYLTAYNTATGQLVLLIVGGLFAAGLTWQTRIARLPEPGRFLATPATSAAESPLPEQVHP
jgi:Flp pilus assembly protein TadB